MSNEAISLAKTRLVVMQPFFGVLAWHMQYIEVPDDELPTLATDGSEKIFYSKRFIEALDNDGKTFGVVHEIMHCVNATMTRQGSRDPRIWNYATDFVINGMLVDAGFKIPQLPSYMTSKLDKNGDPPKILYDPKYKGWTAEKVYDDLLAQCKGDPKNAKRFAGGWFDGHGYTAPPQDGGERMRRLFSEAIQQVGVGNAPASIQRLYKDMCTPRIDWKSLLATVVGSVRADDYTFTPPESAFFGHGITIPTLSEGQILKATVIIDTSGSISDKDISVVMTELRSLVSQFAAWEIKAFCFDGKPYPVQTFSHDDEDISMMKITGGGGTAFRPALKVAIDIQDEDHETDVTVFFTDGYGEGWCEDLAHKFKRMVWIINNKEQIPTWGEHCVYDTHG